MSIRYLCVHPSAMTPKMSVFDSSHITAAVYRKNLELLNLGARDILSIFFEQMILTNYLLEMNGAHTQLQNYKQTLQMNFKRCLEQRDIDTAEASLITAADLSIIKEYMDTGKLPSNAVSSLVAQFTGSTNSKYCALPANFTEPYLNVVSGMKQMEVYLNPIVLSARAVKLNDGSDDSVIHLYSRSYPSMKNEKSTTTDKPTLTYISSMNYNGRSWKEFVDVLQSLYVGDITKTGVESLSGLLKCYLHGRPVPNIFRGTATTSSLLTSMRELTNAYPSLIMNDKSEMEEFSSLFDYLGDPRLKFLCNDNPTVGAAESWSQQLDLQFLSQYHVEYGIEAADNTASKEDTSEDGDTPADDTTGSDDSPEDPDDNEDTDDGTDNTEEGGEDPFNDGDDFSDDTSSDDGGEDSSSSSSTTDTSSDEVKPEDVNPLIELIDNESFDDYLDRGTLQNHIRALINNPPSTIQTEDVDFLKYWMTQWFSLVSVATTREILGDLLELD